MPTPARVIVLVSRFDHASCPNLSRKLLLLLLMMVFTQTCLIAARLDVKILSLILFLLAHLKNWLSVG